MPPRADLPVILRRTTVALGTFVTLEADASSAWNGVELLDRACDVFESVDELMHPTRDGSDLALIAAAHPGQSVRIRPWTFDLLTLCVQLWRDSGGVFDPCVPERPGRLHDIELQSPDCVQIHRKSVAMDLGGIAKGFAIDRAIDLFARAGCSSALVNAGGDARVLGLQSQNFELRIGGTFVRNVALTNEAIAVSEPRTERSPSGHRGFYLPATGEQVAGGAVAVCAPTASIADALTKCALLSSATSLSYLLRRYGAGLIAFSDSAYNEFC